MLFQVCERTRVSVREILRLSAVYHSSGCQNSSITRKKLQIPLGFMLYSQTCKIYYFSRKPNREMRQKDISLSILNFIQLQRRRRLRNGQQRYFLTSRSSGKKSVTCQLKQLTSSDICLNVYYKIPRM